MRSRLMSPRSVQLQYFNVLMEERQSQGIHRRNLPIQAQISVPASSTEIMLHHPPPGYFYISPHHPSRPYTVPTSQNQSMRSSYHLSPEPSFDNFSLPHLFANAPLSSTLSLRRNLHPHDRDDSMQDEEMENRHDDRSNFRKWLNKRAYTNVEVAGTHHGRFPLGFEMIQSKKSRPREKGLRRLSQRAFQIVNTLKAATYKQVANKLVEQLTAENELDSLGKDQQNIKRRVYDALNVLIALGVLKKEGRKIVGEDRKSKISDEEIEQVSEGAVNRLSELIKQKQDIIQEKKTKERKLLQDGSLSWLVSHNIHNPIRNERVPLPFVGVELSSNCPPSILSFTGQTLQLQATSTRVIFDLQAIKWLRAMDENKEKTDEFEQKAP